MEGDILQTVHQDRRQLVLRQPLGVAASITPWYRHLRMTQGCNGSHPHACIGMPESKPCRASIPAVVDRSSSLLLRLGHFLQV